MHLTTLITSMSGPWLCGLASKIYDAHPAAYISAVNRLAPAFKQEALDCKKAPDAP
jgi:hypothetical protein